jgi:hypothetical protein
LIDPEMQTLVKAKNDLDDMLANLEMKQFQSNRQIKEID